MTDLGFTIADVLTQAQAIMTLIGPYLAAVIGIPFAFYLARQAKGMFATGRR